MGDRLAWTRIHQLQNINVNTAYNRFIKSVSLVPSSWQRSISRRLSVNFCLFFFKQATMSPLSVGNHCCCLQMRSLPLFALRGREFYCWRQKALSKGPGIWHKFAVGPPSVSQAGQRSPRVRFFMYCSCRESYTVTLVVGGAGLPWLPPLLPLC